MILPAYLLLAAPVLAKQDIEYEQPAFSYSYVDVAYFIEDIDGLNDEATGFELEGSFAVNEIYRVFAGFASGEVESAGSDVDVELLRIGAGVIQPLNDRADLVLDAFFLNADASAFGSSTSESGWGVEATARAWATDQVELDAGLGYIDVTDGNLAFSAGARYYATPTVSFGAEATFAEDSDKLALGARFQF